MPERTFNPVITVITVVFFVLAVVITVVNYAPTGALPIDAPVSMFSAERALDILRRLNPEQESHPIGTVANERVRERIVAEFERAGCDVELQQGIYATPGDVWARATNVLAWVRGQRGGKVIIAMAHYDSVPAGPGMADDGHAVATLVEVARILAAEPDRKHSILFLATDGEEFGLLGAECFAAYNRELLNDVVAVVNVEARGSSGPSSIYQTGPDSRWLVETYAASSPKPLSTSLIPAIYDRFPTDNDYSVFKRLGIPGFMVAFLGDYQNMHNPLDTLENIDPNSVQHQGDSVLAVLRSLVHAEDIPQDSGNLVFFDLAGLFVVSWPESWTMILSVVALLSVIVAFVLLMNEKELSLGAFLWSLFQALVSVTLVAAGGFGFIKLMFLITGEASRWPAVIWPYIGALWLIAVLGCGVALRVFYPKVTGWGLWSAIWFIMALLGVISALILPGASFYFIVPVLAAGLLVIVEAVVKAVVGWRYGYLSVLVPAVLLAPPLAVVAYSGVDAGGIGMNIFVTVSLALMLAAVVPHALRLPRRLLSWGCAVLFILIVALGVVAAISPVYTSTAPRAVNILFHQSADSSVAHWNISASVGPVVQQLVRQGLVEEQRVLPMSFISADPYMVAGQVPAPDALPPRLEILNAEQSGDSVNYILHLISQRGASVGGIVFPPEKHPSAIRMFGVPPPEDQSDETTADYWDWYYTLTLPPEGVVIEVTMPTAEPVEVYYYDRSWNLPLEAAPLVNALPENACPRGNGHYWYITDNIVLSLQETLAEEQAESQPSS